MTETWTWLLSLPFWQQALLLGGVVASLGLGVAGVASSRRSKRRTVYVLDDRSRVTASAPVTAGAGSRTAPTNSPPESDVVDDRVAEDINVGEAWAAEWANGRPLCPCCGYATTYDEFVPCALCDWEEPVAPEPGWEVATSERLSQLEVARARYAATGSALSPEDRGSWAGELTGRQVELRRELRAKLDYLKGGERPDTSESWEEVDRLLAALGEEAERKRTDEPGERRS
jgi:hypothetical protein